MFLLLPRLDVLIRMALSADPTTQEHAVEAIAELLTIPSIQVCKELLTLTHL